ncbi:P-loop NTPase [Halostagnicola sp. A-GB9-2]|uniref:P-loop NTPase n=1 Tax=Halostagnicola sp. A-GB9-2 TaxID=3048066 RepID=UPI0024BF82C2|nr:P-loop NTPase [Halostagnicola sp. A-GB9-2]MDJ1433117.1 P-loop NTPase [Halostagnicola sp. A-GB9-2]
MEATPPRPDDEVRRAVVDGVRTVRIPGGDPISEQLLEEVIVEDGIVTFVVNFGRLDQPMANRLTDQLRGVALATPDVEHTRVEAVEAEAPETGLPVTGVESLIAVGSAKGGVGKTTIAVSLARALDAAGLDVAVFDANVHAPDAPDLLDTEGPVQSTPSGSPMPVLADGIEVMSVELIAEDGPVAWRGAMVHDVVTDLLGNAVWEGRDVLLVDLPPGIGEAVTTLVQQAPLDGGLLVSTPTSAGARSTERTGALFEAYGVPTIGVAPNMVATEGEDLESPYACDSRSLTNEIDSVDPVNESLEPIPFDPALRDPLTMDVVEPSTPGEEAIVSLATCVQEFLSGSTGPEVPEEAVDLRGLPPTSVRRQAIAEFGVADDSPVSIVMRGDAEELSEVVEQRLEYDGRSLARTTIDDLGRDGWLLELKAEADASTPSTSEPAA